MAQKEPTEIYLFDVKQDYSTGSSSQLNVRKETIRNVYKNFNLQAEMHCTANTGGVRFKGGVKSYLVCVRCFLKWQWSMLGIQYIHMHLISKQFQVSSEEEIKVTEVIEVWWPSNVYTASGPAPRIYNIDVVMHHNFESVLVHHHARTTCSDAY